MGGEASDQLQQVLLEQIIGSFKKKSDAVERISELLHLGKDAVYRRLRGETLLTPKEIQLLATAFGISLDSLVFQNTNSLIFSMNALSGKIQSFRDFFEGLSASSITQLMKSPCSTFFSSRSCWNSSFMSGVNISGTSII